MGFQDNSGEIFIDAVLTDEGRELISQNNGKFQITRWRPADDEIDYRFWNELTGSDSKDLKILDTPVFEASSNEGTALRYPLITVNNARLQYLPKLEASYQGGSTLVLSEQNDQTGTGKTLKVQQVNPVNMSEFVGDLFDPSYRVDMDGDLIKIANASPVSRTPYGRAGYLIQSDTDANNVGLPSVSFDVKVAALTREVWTILAGARVGNTPRQISTTIVVTGQTSGLTVSVPVVINEYVAP